MSKTSDQDAQEHLYHPHSAEARMEAEIERLKAEVSKIQATGLFKSYKHWENEAETLRARVEELNSEANNVRQACKTLREERDEVNRILKKTVDTKHSTNVLLQERVEELEAKMVYHPQKELIKERDALQLRVDALEYCSSGAMILQEKYEIERDEARSRVEELGSDLARCIRERDELRTRLAKLTETNNYATDERIRLADKCRDLESRLARQERDSTDQIEHLKDVSTKRKFEIEDLKSRLIELDKTACYQTDRALAAETRLGMLNEVCMGYRQEIRDGKAREETLKHNQELIRKMIRQPPAPHVVKQTFEAVYSDDQFPTGKMRNTRELCIVKAVKDGTFISILRKDYYSDGSVKAVLEPVGEEK